MPSDLPKRIVGIDYGLARIGVAVSDESRIIASPLANINVKKKSTETVNMVIETLSQIEKDKQCRLETVVVGLPLQMDGRSGPAADAVGAFAELLKKEDRWNVVLWDERLTTVQAERSMRQAGMRRKQRAKVVDGITAVIILQSYLDSLGRTLNSEDFGELP